MYYQSSWCLEQFEYSKIQSWWNRLRASQDRSEITQDFRPNKVFIGLFQTPAKKMNLEMSNYSRRQDIWKRVSFVWIHRRKARYIKLSTVFQSIENWAHCLAPQEQLIWIILQLAKEAFRLVIFIYPNEDNSSRENMISERELQRREKEMFNITFPLDGRVQEL